jgi:alkaline phosphatase
MRGLAAIVLAAAVGAGCATRKPPTAPALPRARNVILFLGDAGGLPTVHGASVNATGGPRGLFLHTLKHVALSETSSASQWVTDSAAGMTAIVTGHKTHNGVLSQSETAVRRQQDGAPLKTILEHAEERGLATGVVSNSSVLSATPAACYAHVNDRANEVEIFRQLLKPQFGDGVDVVIGDGLSDVTAAATATSVPAHDALRAAGLPLYDALDAVPASARRAAVLFDVPFDLDAATQRAIDVLSRNPKGFFLMVEGNVHVEELLHGLARTVELDRTMRRVAERLGTDTLLLFTADHSYDFRIHSGRKGQPLLPGVTDPGYGDDLETLRLENVRRDDDHTGEDVLVVARGPGAERVRGFLSNTDLFHIMMSAFGWDPAPGAGGTR